MIYNQNLSVEQIIKQSVQEAKLQKAKARRLAVSYTHLTLPPPPYV